MPRKWLREGVKQIHDTALRVALCSASPEFRAAASRRREPVKCCGKRNRNSWDKARDPPHTYGKTMLWTAFTITRQIDAPIEHVWEIL